MKSFRVHREGSPVCRQPIAILLLLALAMAQAFCPCNSVFAAEGDLVWAKQVSGPGGATAYAAATVSDGSSLVTGSFGGTVTFGPGEANETSMTAGGVDVFVAKYDMNGRLVWVKRSDGNGYGSGVATLTDGSAVVTGHLTDATVTFGQGEPNETILVGAYYDMFLAKFNPDGTLRWAERMPASFSHVLSQLGREIALLPDDSALVTGAYCGEVTFGSGEPNQTTLTSAGDIDMFVAKYGYDGRFMWAKGAGGIYADEGFGVAALADGSAVVSGYFQRTATFSWRSIAATVISYG